MCMDEPGVDTPRTSLYPVAYRNQWASSFPAPPFPHLKGIALRPRVQLLRGPGLAIKFSSVRYLPWAPSSGPLPWPSCLLPGLALTKERILHTEAPHSITYREHVGKCES